MKNEKFINQQIQWLEEQLLHDELLNKTKTLDYQSLFFRAYLIKVFSIYTNIKNKEPKNEYYYKTRGKCLTLLFICETFDYLDKQQISNYRRILNQNIDYS